MENQIVPVSTHFTSLPPLNLARARIVPVATSIMTTKYTISSGSPESEKAKSPALLNGVTSNSARRSMIRKRLPIAMKGMRLDSEIGLRVDTSPRPQ